MLIHGSHRELLGVTVQLIGYTGGDNKQPNIVESDSLALLAKHKALVQRLERVVLLLDAALVEARLAREAMLLYIQVS